MILELFVLCLFCALNSTVYAVFNPESIPEEEQSAVAEEQYYDAEDKKINEKVNQIKLLDIARQKSSDSHNYISKVRTLLNNEPCKYDFLQKKSNYANYVRENAAAYALAYAESHNSEYKNLGSNDCTNFVSQAIAVGGVYSYINSNFTSTPSLLKTWILGNL